MFGIRSRWWVLAAFGSVALFLAGCQQDAADRQQAREEYETTPQDLPEQDPDDRVVRNYRGPLDEEEDDSRAADRAQGDEKRNDGRADRKDPPATAPKSETLDRPTDENASEKNREEFVKEVQDGLDKVRQEIKKLEQAATELEGEAKEKLQQKIEEAQARLQEAEKQLEQLQDASEQQFREQRKQLEQTLMEMLELVKPAA